MQSLIESGRLIPVLEQDDEPYRFSTPVAPPSQDDLLKRPEPKHTAAQEKVFHIEHPQWSDDLLVSGERAVRARNHDGANIRWRSENVFALAWDHWGREEYVKTQENRYRRIDYREIRVVNEVNKYRKILVVNPFDGRNTVFRHTDYPLVAFGYTQWDYLLLLDRMEEDLEATIKKMPQLRTVMFTGLCKDSLSSLHLALRLKRKKPGLNVGVLGCSWACDFAGKSPYCGGRLLSPSHEKVRGIEPYKSLLARHGDALTMLRRAAEEGVRVHLFGFYAWRPGCTFEEEATLRLREFTTRNYVWKATEEEGFDILHGKALQLAKKSPLLIQAMFEDAIRIASTSPPERQHVAINLN